MILAGFGLIAFAIAIAAALSLPEIICFCRYLANCVARYFW